MNAQEMFERSRTNYEKGFPELFLSQMIRYLERYDVYIIPTEDWKTVDVKRLQKDVDNGVIWSLHGMNSTKVMIICEWLVEYYSICGECNEP